MTRLDEGGVIRDNDVTDAKVLYHHPIPTSIAVALCSDHALMIACDHHVTIVTQLHRLVSAFGDAMLTADAWSWRVVSSQRRVVLQASDLHDGSLTQPAIVVLTTHDINS